MIFIFVLFQMRYQILPTVFHSIKKISQTANCCINKIAQTAKFGGN